MNVTNGTRGGGMFMPPPQPDTSGIELVWVIVPSIIIPIGTIGNVLSIITLLRPHNRKTSTALYLLALAVSDLVILWTGPLRMVVRSRTPDQTDLRTLSVPGCRAHMFLIYLSLQFSSWMLVAVTMERVMSVLYAHRIKQLSTRRLACSVILMCFVVLFCLNIHILIYIGDGFIPEVGIVLRCVPMQETYKDFMRYVYPWIDFCVAFLAPFVVLLVGNIIILYSVWKQRGTRRKLSIMQSSQLRSSERQIRSLTLMLVLLCVVFFLTMTPGSIFIIGLVYWEEDIGQDIEGRERLLLWYGITTAFLYVNASTNFYLYCLSGSKFRADVKQLFCCKIKSSNTSMFEQSSPPPSTPSVTSLPASSYKKTTSEGSGVVSTNQVQFDFKGEEKGEINQGYDGSVTVSDQTL